jgi:hypothetical protein
MPAAADVTAEAAVGSAAVAVEATVVDAAVVAAAGAGKAIPTKSKKTSRTVPETGERGSASTIARPVREISQLDAQLMVLRLHM